MTEIKLNKKEEKELFFKALLGSPFFNIFASVLATFIVGAVFLKFGGGVPINVTQTSITKTSTFDVRGEGKVVVVPDMARVRLAVEKQGRDVKRLQDQVGEIMDQTVSSLKKLGVKPEDIKTVDYSVYQDYDKVGVFRIYMAVEVQVRELEKLDEVLALGGELGLERVSGPIFDLSVKLREKTMRQAREEAVQEAKLKAKELAGLTGMKLGKIVNVKEDWGGADVYMPISPIREMGAGDENKIHTEARTNVVEVGVVVSWEVE